MAKVDRTEALLESLAVASRDPGSPESIALLRKALKGRSAHAAGRAAQIAGDGEVEALVPDLVAAFRRFCDDPVRRDPGCAAKSGIADALYRMGACERDLYRSGIRHVQMEPVWGGRVDTATALRGTCAFALVRSRAPDAMLAIAELLADREAPARKAAAQALAYSEDGGALPLLRLKALIGDDEPEVLGECLLALLAISGVESLEFVARFLESEEEGVAESAALALGGSRLVEALPVLCGWWEGTSNATLRRAALLAVAMLKRPSAIEYLITHVAESSGLDARDAVAALAIYRFDEKLRMRVGGVVAGRADPSLDRYFRESFGAP